MSPLELIRLALSRLRRGRVRAALTMLGVVIGVASVVGLVSVGTGTTARITQQLSSLGTNLLTISPSGFSNGDSTLTLDDAKAIEALQGLAGVAPEIQTQATVAASATNTATTSIVGTSAAYATVRAYDVWQGTFLTDVAVDRSLRVAVLGATTASNLGLGAEAVGTEIRIGGIPFTIAGILQPKGGAGFANPDDEVLIPIGTVQKYFVGGNGVRSVGVSVADDADMTSVRNQISELLRVRHGIGASDQDDFSIFDQTQLLQAASTITGTLTLLLGGIASIALLVGGIGIMNIMLVSVRERTREIGIRMALGARRRDIQSQFLIEALTLSVIGGFVGVLFGLLISAGIGKLAGWGFIFDPGTIVVATVFSLAVGIVFGVWPARQAARLDPVVALRFE
ncbi:MAG TPA: ABC transporter permease [Candidatus Limnocylindrales bacterium]|nr:ABC transporter permease [Candidatus Limnocylindrales bacterium]